MSKIEAKRDGVTYCVYMDESCLPDKDMLKSMKTSGYKFYKDGKLYKPEENKNKTTQN